MPNLVGGLADHQAADNHINEILSKVRDHVETKLGKFPQFVAESYRTQVVNGTNYFVKVHTGDDSSRLHLRIYKPFTGEPEFVSHLPDRKHDEPVNYF